MFAPVFTSLKASIPNLIAGCLVSLILLSDGIAQQRVADRRVCPIATLNQEPGTKPNILFILTDDMDLASLDFMPNVKALLGDRGITFSDAFVTESLCCPSRTSILRSQYVHSHQVEANKMPLGGFQKYHDSGYEHCDIAGWLSQAAYRTALMGKYLNDYPGSLGSDYRPPDWFRWLSPTTKSAYTEYNYVLNFNGKVKRFGSKPEDYLTDVINQHAQRFISKAINSRQPFFLYLAPFAPHQPATAAPRHKMLFRTLVAPRGGSYNETDVSDKPAYIRAHKPMKSGTQAAVDFLFRKRIRSLQAVDEMVRDLVLLLEQTGQIDNTYIVFTSDNGFHLGQHRLASGKQTPYEEDIRVPLIIRGPGIPAGITRSQLVLESDLAPTFSKWAGAVPPRFVEGRDLSPLLSDEVDSALSWRKALLVEHYATEVEPFEPTQLATATGIGSALTAIPGYKAMRTTDSLYVEYTTGEHELYDLSSDPFELENIYSAASVNLKSELSSKLAALAKCSGAGCRRAEE